MAIKIEDLHGPQLGAITRKYNILLKELNNFIIGYKIAKNRLPEQITLTKEDFDIYEAKTKSHEISGIKLLCK